MILVCDSKYAVLVGIINQFYKIHTCRRRVEPYLDGCIVAPIIGIKLNSKIMTGLKFRITAESCIPCYILE